MPGGHELTLETKLLEDGRTVMEQRLDVVGKLRPAVALRLPKGMAGAVHAPGGGAPGVTLALGSLAPAVGAKLDFFWFAAGVAKRRIHLNVDAVVAATSTVGPKLTLSGGSGEAYPAVGVAVVVGTPEPAKIVAAVADMVLWSMAAAGGRTLVRFGTLAAPASVVELLGPEEGRDWAAALGEANPLTADLAQMHVTCGYVPAVGAVTLPLFQFHVLLGGEP